MEWKKRKERACGEEGMRNLWFMGTSIKKRNQWQWPKIEEEDRKVGDAL